MKKILPIFLLAFFVFGFTQSEHEHPLVVTLHDRMILYQDCENVVGTSVPTLGRDYKPTFKTDNGTFIFVDGLGECVVCPSNLGKCTISVSSDEKEIGNWQFRVLPVPAPNIFLGSNTGAEISIAESLKKASYRIMVRPETNFLNTLPEEARYRISGLTVNIYRKGRKVKSSSVENGELDLKDAQAGDMVQAIVTKTERINSQGKLLLVTPLNPVINFMVKD